MATRKLTYARTCIFTTEMSRENNYILHATFCGCFLNIVTCILEVVNGSQFISFYMYTHNPCLKV